MRDQKLHHENEQKLVRLRVRNDVTHALQLKLHERMDKKQI